MGPIDTVGDLAAVPLGVLILWGAVAKLSQPAATRAAMATFGIDVPPVAASVWGTLVVVELALGLAVVANVAGAALVAMAAMLVFAAALGLAMAHGRGGQPCGCFGARGRVGVRAIVRNLALAAALGLVPVLSTIELAAVEWVAVGAAVGAVGVVVLAVTVAALAREVATLRLLIGPQMALDIEGEGPPLGSYVPQLKNHTPDSRAHIVLGVFSSDGCPMCEALRPAIADIARDPQNIVKTFDEHADQSVWRELAIPGSPYAVVAALDGTVRAKGTFNSLGQLDALLTGARRMAQRESADA